jgi:putative ABC transport system substrate-binding protein
MGFTETDALACGFVTSLARPGGNITGFTVFEYGISPKWLELFEQIAPHVTRAAVLRRSHSRFWNRAVGRNPRGRTVIWNST